MSYPIEQKMHRRVGSKQAKLTRRATQSGTRFQVCEHQPIAVEIPRLAHSCAKSGLRIMAWRKAGRLPMSRSRRLFDLCHRPAAQLVRVVNQVHGPDPILDAQRHDAVEDTVARENYPRLAVDC